MTILAWHFLKDENGKPVLRDDTPLKVGKMYVHKGELELCESGYHASIRAIDALSYASGNWVSLVECSGKIIEDEDKLVCSHRKALWCYDAESVLRQFARECALSVLHLWDPPPVVVDYLNTGDISIRAAAMDATMAAAIAVRDVAAPAAITAARAATSHAAVAAAWDSSVAAAWTAVWAAAFAAWTATRDAQNAMLEGVLLAESGAL